MKNEELFQLAQQFIPGGVNSPVRAFGSVGGTPPFIVSASGCHLTDADGKQYVDYVGSWGPMILGHGEPRILDAIREALSRGTSFGAPTESEVDLARLISERVPSAEMTRLVSSGTEATMTAVRLARGATGRDVIVKFEGCYHGHADSFLVAAGSGAATHGHPSSPGVPRALAELTRTAPFNDLAAVRDIFAGSGADVAAVVVEPVAGNMGCVAPEPGFLEGLRELCSAHGALLIFDEVMTGFRVHPRCAQTLYGIEPDLTTLGKIVGGGMPMGAVCGPKRWMQQLSPTGPVYQAGTLSGNPLSVAAGLRLLSILREEEQTIYGQLEEKSRQLTDRMSEILTERGIPHTIPRVGSMFCLYFREQPVKNFHDAQSSDGECFKRYFHGMLERGVYLAPSAFEAAFLSTAHQKEALDVTIESLRNLEF